MPPCITLRSRAVKKVTITILPLVMAFSLAGAGWAAPPPMMDDGFIWVTSD
jgi:hypothetical protein